MKVALIQSPAIMGDVKANFGTAASLVARADGLGAEVFIFPEMSLTGYFDKAAQMEKSISKDDPFVKEMIALSENGKTVIFGISEKNDRDRYITQLVAQDGHLIGEYRKQNLAGDELKNYIPGKSTPLFTVGQHTFGLTICADIDLDFLYKRYKEKGCSVVFECASPDLWGDSKNRNWVKGYNWWRGNCIEKIGKYAGENKMKIAVATMSGRNEYGDFPGGGYLFAEDGEIASETIDYQDEILIINIDKA